ncbi:MFS transporter [Streptomyces sp. MP131-18]|uniref:MFS transporter n=1 Tax=Streptomyces sp. MP131-18 TaxID=1857892 RepID=UPI00097C37DF|nr:MFS transporter [Streptomyces sp. MP131-18]ONK09887.1 Inner membrane protein YbjJ [Streptomyces sp. MP131-18]
MAKAAIDPRTARWRAALFAMFLLPGVAMSSWITRTPDIRDRVGASTAEMGLIIFGLSIGAMAGVLCSASLVARYGGRAVTTGGAAVNLAGLAVVALGAGAGSGAVVFCGLALFGAGSGLMEIAVNVEGAAVERVIGRPVLPALHGCFSAGTFAGATTGVALTAVDFPVQWHLLIVVLLGAALSVWALRHVPRGTGQERPGSTEAPALGARERLAVWRERRVVLLGLIVLGMALAEGAANDWLPLIMVDGYDLDAATGSLVYALFAASMAVGRFSGERLLSRFGRVTVVRAGAVCAAVGLATVVLAPHPAPAAAAVVLWGLGAALGFPLTLSAAGDDPQGAAARVSAVAITGYLAFLAGPPALGFLGEAVGLRNAMLAVLAVVLLAGTLATAVRPLRPAQQPPRASGPAPERETTDDAPPGSRA